MKDDSLTTTPSILNWLENPDDPDGWASFTLRYQAKIHAWCCKRGLQPHDADDVTQDVLLAIQKKIKSYRRDAGRFYAWLRTVTRNACIDVIRKQGSLPMSGDIKAVEELAQVFEDELPYELLRAALEMTRGDVSSRDWSIYAAMVFGERSGKELAEEHGMTEAAVFKAKSRVGKIVKSKALELEEGFDGGMLADA